MRYTKVLGKLNIDFENEWDQLFTECNWYISTLIHAHFEDDKYAGSREIELKLLGFGIRFYWAAPNPVADANFKRWEKMIKAWEKGSKRK